MQLRPWTGSFVFTFSLQLQVWELLELPVRAGSKDAGRSSVRIVARIAASANENAARKDRAAFSLTRSSNFLTATPRHAPTCIWRPTPRPAIRSNRHRPGCRSDRDTRRL